MLQILLGESVFLHRNKIGIDHATKHAGFSSVSPYSEDILTKGFSRLKSGVVKILAATMIFTASFGSFRYIIKNSPSILFT